MEPNMTNNNNNNNNNNSNSNNMMHVAPQVDPALYKMFLQCQWQQELDLNQQQKAVIDNKYSALLNMPVPPAPIKPPVLPTKASAIKKTDHKKGKVLGTTVKSAIQTAKSSKQNSSVVASRPDGDVTYTVEHTISEINGQVLPLTFQCKYMTYNTKKLKGNNWCKYITC